MAQQGVADIARTLIPLFVKVFGNENIYKICKIYKIYKIYKIIKCTKYTKYISNNPTFSVKNESFKTYIYYISKLHNSYFVYFVYIIYFVHSIYFVYIYEHLYEQRSRSCNGGNALLRHWLIVRMMNEKCGVAAQLFLRVFSQKRL